MMNLTIRTLLALMLSWTVASREQGDFTCYRQAHAAYHQTLHKMPVHQMPPPTHLSAHEQAREAASSRKHHELLKQHHAEEATASSRKHHKTTVHLTAAASGKHFRFSSESPTVAPHVDQHTPPTLLSKTKASHSTTTRSFTTSTASTTTVTNQSQAMLVESHQEEDEATGDLSRPVFYERGIRHKEQLLLAHRTA